MFKKKTSRYELRTLGVGDESLDITEEERALNFHILGAPGEGKSKFLEDQIRKDIDIGNGLCLIDPSEGGDTAKNILSYCAKIDYRKVILIDPTTISDYGKIPCIAALNPKSVKRSVKGAMEALAILFNSDYGNMRRIRRNLSALLRVLAREKLTLRESIYFSQYGLDKEKRQAILGNDRDSFLINTMFRSEPKFERDFASTVNILDVVWQEPLASIISNKEGIDFLKAVRDGWVILVNLSPYKLDEEQADFLGIIVISQLIQAVEVLFSKNWKGVFYLYIDEAGRFTTPQIDNLLSFKRKSGLRLILAHHYFKQFEDERVLNSVLNNARIKMMFDTPSYDDRLKMVKALGYGGNIPPLMAQFANQNIPKQYAIIRKNKEAPVRIRIEDVKPYPKAPKEYIEKILSQSFYKDVRTTREDSKSSQSRKMDDSETNSPPSVSRGVQGKLENPIRPDDKKPPEPPPKRPIKI